MTAFIKCSYFLLFLVLSYQTFGLDYEVSFAQKDIQERIDKMLPLEREQYLAKIKIRSARVELMDSGNQVKIHPRVIISAFDMSFYGKATMIGTLHFDPNQNAFFIRNAYLTSFEVEDIPDALSGAMEGIVQDTLNQALSNKPVYVVDGSRLQYKSIKGILKSVKIKNKRLVVTFSVDESQLKSPL